MKHLFINSSAFLLMVTTHCATAAVYDFNVLVTDSGYTDTIECDSCSPPDDFQETTGQLYDVGERVQVSFEYDIADSSPSSQDYYAISLDIGNETFKQANSLDYSVTTALTNAIPGSGDSDVLSVSFIDEFDSGNTNYSTIIDLIFTDTTGTALSSGEMPGELDLGAFSTVSIEYDYLSEDYRNRPNFHFYEEYLNAEFSPVPLPPVVYLFVSGLIGIFGITRRGLLPPKGKSSP